MAAKRATRRSLGVVLLVRLVLVHVRKAARHMRQTDMQHMSSVTLAMLDFAPIKTDTATRYTTPTKVIGYIRLDRELFKHW